MPEKRFTKSFKHTKATITRLSEIQYLAFCKISIALQLIIGLVFVFSGIFFVNDKIVKALFILFGCILIVGWKELPKLKADKIVSGQENSLPETGYVFSQQELSVTAKNYSQTFPYSSIYALIDDGKYEYLFMNKEGGFMIRKDNEDADFQQFLSEKTKKEWIDLRKTGSFFYFKKRIQKMK